jgi:hypothetical protein
MKPSYWTSPEGQQCDQALTACRNLKLLAASPQRKTPD